MKQLTVAVDDRVLREARRVAARRSTSISALVRGFLEDLASQELGTDEARSRIIQLCQESDAEVGPWEWTRDELY